MVTCESEASAGPMAASRSTSVSELPAYGCTMELERQHLYMLTSMELCLMALQTRDWV